MQTPRDGARPRAIFAFSRDLRLSDHAGLAAAARFGDVIPVLVIDAGTTVRMRLSPRRAVFFCAAVANLDAALRRRGLKLIVRRGVAGTVLRGLARGIGATAVGWTVRYDPVAMRADRNVQSKLEEAGIRVFTVHDAPALPPDDPELAPRRGDGARSFVPYFSRWTAVNPAPIDAEVPFATTDVPSEPLPEPEEFGASSGPRPDDADETTVLARVTAFLTSTVLNYGVARNVPAAGGTSCLSAALSFGTIAARTVVRASRERSRDPFLLVEEQTSLRLFERSLAQRDFFQQLAWHNETLDDSPLQEKMRAFAFARSHPQLDAWRTGRTGFPIVDAGIRELHATGWMHPRVRSIAASFVAFDLGVDWRIARDEWDRHLVEDSPELATGNWQWAAGVGADLAAYPRIYNPMKQARRFDPTAEYIRRWVPELRAASDAAILDREAAARAPQLTFPLFGAESYPAPIVDHDHVARDFLDRYTRETVSA